LSVVVVGDITADELGKFVDEVFGSLPATASLAPLPAIGLPSGGRLRVVDMDVSQSALSFGMGSVPYDGPDYIPAYVLNHIIGGGVSSKLGEELRQKRGLAFSVSTWLGRYRQAAVFRGAVATRNEMVGESLDVIREELRKAWAGALTQADLENAKSYIIGSYPLRFDAHGKIAWELLRHSMLGFGPEFFENRKVMIEAVTLEDLRAVAKRMLDPENLIVSIAGSPALQPARTV
jgi:zinc protease